MAIAVNGTLENQETVLVENFRKKDDLAKSNEVLRDLRKSLNVLCYGNTQGDKTETVYLGKVLKNTLNILDRSDFRDISLMNNHEAGKLFKNIATAYNIRMSDLRDKINSGNPVAYSSEDALVANNLKDRISQLGRSLEQDVGYVESSGSIKEIMMEDESKEVVNIYRYVGLNKYKMIQRENAKSEQSIETKIIPRGGGKGSGGNDNQDVDESPKRVMNVRDNALEKYSPRKTESSFISGLRSWGRKVKESVIERVEDSVGNSRGYFSGWKNKLSFGFS